MATRKISDLPPCTPLTGIESLPVVQSAATVRATLDELPLSTSVSTALATKQNRTLERAIGVLIPMYLYPADVFTNADYNGVIDLAKMYHQVPVTVALNPSNGPGEVVDGNFTVAIRRMQGAAITVLGYVHTTGGARDIALVKEDIDSWRALYPAINGLFIDEMSNDDSVTHRAYFTELTRYSHANDLFPVIGNPGAGLGNAYFTEQCADIIVVYENSTYPDEATMQGDYDGGYMDVDYRRRAALVYGQTYDDNLVPLLTKHVGMVYVTTATLPNPWSTVSPGLSDLMDALRS